MVREGEGMVLWLGDGGVKGGRYLPQKHTCLIYTYTHQLEVCPNTRFIDLSVGGGAVPFDFYSMAFFDQYKL